jgi:UDP-2-acetamido-3-amino-2,3-dideoxy-glucuronate N-acetyltransferase
MKGAKLGMGCILGQNVFVANDVKIGNNVKIQNNVSIYTGVELEDDVFCGPSCVFTNISNPRSQIVRRHMYERTLIRRGATIGANATIVCGREVGRYAFIGAGATVASNVPDYALMLGVPARQVGWMSRHGHRLPKVDSGKLMVCSESHWRYQEVERGIVRCLDWPEDRPLSD